MQDGLVERTDAAHGYYEHTTRPDWGVAALVWEREGKRGFRFVDGRLRIFKRGYYHLLREVAADSGQREALASYTRSAASPGRTSDAPNPAADAVKLSEQIDFFRSLYPEGFAGEKWRREHRRPTNRALQRHREPALKLARAKLALTEIDRAISEGRPEDVATALRDVLAKTDLVTAAQRNKLGGLQQWQAQRLAASLRELLWSAAPLDQRFGAWISALAVATASRTAPWGLATAPLALVHPTKHVCVRESSFRAQGAIMVPPHNPGRAAAVAPYREALSVAMRVRDRLRRAGLDPADMFDVYDFMWLTLRPKARAAIVARRESATAEGVEPGARSEASMSAEGDCAAA